MSSLLKTNSISAATGSTVLIPSGTTLDIASGATIDATGATVTGFGGDNTPSFRAYLSTNQLGTTNGAWNKVNFDTEDWDTDSAYDNSTNYRFTVPSGEGGKYMFSAEVGVAPSSGADDAGDYARLKFYVNGAGYTKGDGFVWGVVHAAGYDIYIGNTAILNLAAADYVEVYCYHTLGTSRKFSAATSYFAGYKLIGV